MNKKLTLLTAAMLCGMLAGLVSAGGIATRSDEIVAVAAPGGGSATWTVSAPYSSIELLYIDCYQMAAGATSTVTVQRVTSATDGRETIATIGGGATSNGTAAVYTSNVGKTLLNGDVLNLNNRATNLGFKAKITYKVQQ